MNLCKVLALFEYVYKYLQRIKFKNKHHENFSDQILEFILKIQK